MILDHHVFDAIVLDKHDLYDSIYMIMVLDYYDSQSPCFGALL